MRKNKLDKPKLDRPTRMLNVDNVYGAKTTWCSR